MSVRRSLIFLTILVLTLPICIFGVSATQLMQAREPDQNLRFYVAAQGDVRLFVTGIGKIEAASVADLSFTRIGKVAEVFVQQGDTVQKGDVLATLVQDNEQLAYDRAVLNLQLAELQKQDVLKPVDDSAIRVAEANLKSAQGAYLGIQNAVSPTDLQAAELRYQQALAAKAQAEKARTNADGGQVDQVYQLLDAQVGAASFNAEIARLQLESLKTGNRGALNAAYARVTQAQKELERVKAGPTQTQIDQANIAVQQAQLQVNQASRTLTDMSLIAPFNGVVSVVNIQIGSLGSPALPAVQLTDISPLHVLVQVDEIDIHKVRQGSPALVKVDALPGVEFLATIETIALVGTNDNGIINYDVRVRLDSSDPRILTGMTAEASVIVNQKSNVLSIPNEYIRLDRQRGKAFVNMVDKQGHLQEVEITLGLQGDDVSEVVAGIDKGDVLAVKIGGDSLSIFGG
ncbi:MAG: efflux RND transporter periplasmic adaptor subunit [Anaerolineaceae bacterium]|nr:efflux RND transporter periplasmic adaptor subunit [Anaerolineaceae bacterium]